VTENTEDKNRAAKERSQDTKRFVRQVRSATRRKYTPEEKIHIVLEGFRREGPVTRSLSRIHSRWGSSSGGTRTLTVPGW
jgi:transposase-like protein